MLVCCAGRSRRRKSGPPSPNSLGKSRLRSARVTPAPTSARKQMEVASAHDIADPGARRNPQRVNSGRLLIPERIDAVVWFSDLRGFTRITKSGSPRTLPSKDALSKHSAEMVLEIQSTACRDKMRARIPASSGLSATSREISVCVRLRGGPERTRTSNQTIIGR
jgi:class 3 adenylate cyclase